MILKHGTIVDGDFNLRQCDLRIADGIITEIGENLTCTCTSVEAPANKHDGTTTPGTTAHEEIIDMTGKFILPGFIDTHMHGAVGHKLSDPNPDLEAITRFEATEGVTSIAIATVCSDFKHILRQIYLAAAAAKNVTGAKIAGIHAEGPFISPKKKGAMDPNYIIPPDIGQLDQMIEHSCGLLKLITLAPEAEGALDIIRHAVSCGIVVSMGHSDATYQETVAAIEAGASQTTHTFNAMRAYSHREPGILGAVLTNPKVQCEMICDHTHLHPATIKMIYSLKGADNINIISDSEHGAGMKEKEILVDGEIRYIEDGVMKMADGTIAGSASTMLDGVKNLIADGIPLTDIAKMASYNPARTLGIDQQTGSITVGKAADLAILDETYHLFATYVDGQCVYIR